MKLDAVMFAVASALFIVFFSNVALGAAGQETFLTDVSEMLVLFASISAFTVAVLRREADENREKSARDD